MRIGRTDYELGHQGRIHDLILGTVPEDGAVDWRDLLHSYEALPRSERTLPLEQVLENLRQAGYLVRRWIDSTTYYARQRWLSSAEAARQLGVSQRTVQAWHQDGRLPGRQVGGRFRFRESDVGAMRTEPPTSFILSGVEDPVLAELWDNESDADYDAL